MSAKPVPDKLTALAFKLADEWAGCTFRSECYPRGNSDSSGDPKRWDPWFEIPSPREQTFELRRCLRWLRARDMLVQNPNDRTQWKTRS